LTIQGKGFYIWQIRRCEAGVARSIANVASQANLTHVLIKIADGASAYNIDPNTGSDLVPPVLNALRERSILVLGWQYVYGYDPDGEANIAIQRIQSLGLDGFVIDAEDSYKQPGRETAARQYMSRLRATLPTFPIALSSYRFPTLHPQLPWQAFLEKCDMNMPQVYWVGAHNPGDQLIRCVREFQAITPFRPIIPTGSAYLQGSWVPTVEDVNQFLLTAQNLNLSAANFWEWGHTRQYLPELWEAIKDYFWYVDPYTQDIVIRYFEAMNTHDPSQVLALYNSQAVHVNSTRTVQGLDALDAWYVSLFNQVLPNATFTLTDYSGNLGSRHFTWTATSDVGSVNNGQDSFGLVSGKIVYHYTSFTVE
jgi:hypothetical protein